jgi:hypothetical protein
MYTLGVIVFPEHVENQTGDPASANLHSGSLLLMCVGLTRWFVHETALQFSHVNSYALKQPQVGNPLYCGELPDDLSRS